MENKTKAEDFRDDESGLSESDDEGSWSDSDSPAGGALLPPTRRRRKAAKGGRRLFTERQRKECWEKAEPVQGRDPARWRYDAAGNVVVRRLMNCEGCLCYEFDHIVPYSKGGLTEQDNCQILQTRANRWKSAKMGVTKEQLRDVSCDLQLSEREMDLLELSLWGDVKRRGLVFKHLNVGEQELLNTEPKESEGRL